MNSVTALALTDPIGRLLGEWSMGLNTYSIILRIAVAVLFASVIGCERSSKRHSAGLWSCGILGLIIGAGLYTVTVIVYLFLVCILAGFPSLETYLKNRSNHFEIHLELKSSEYLQDFVPVIRRLGLRIDDIESNLAYVGSGLSVYTITITISSAELKKYKTHKEIIEALSSLEYIYHIEEMR